MPKTLTEKYEDTGVIIGRFMLDELHEAHKELVDYVCSRHGRVILFLGVSRRKNALEDPLDYRSRKQMFTEAYPNIDVFPIEDVRSNAIWSKKLDSEIRKWINPGETVCLYGGRDSFAKHYSGQFKTMELVPKTLVSATEIRKKIANFYVPTKDYRAGMIAAAAQRYAAVFPTVDVAILSEGRDKVLLGRKPEEDKLRFIGGFAEGKHPSYEADARAEVQQETGLEISEPEYIGSAIIDDWRYRGTRDKIKSLFFKATTVFGKAKANDDISAVEWVFLDNLSESDIMPEHIPLLEMLKQNLIKTIK